MYLSDKWLSLVRRNLNLAISHLFSSFSESEWVDCQFFLSVSVSLLLFLSLSLSLSLSLCIYIYAYIDISTTVTNGHYKVFHGFYSIFRWLYNTILYLKSVTDSVLTKIYVDIFKRWIIKHGVANVFNNQFTTWPKILP